jgi:hypothetical protein
MNNHKEMTANISKNRKETRLWQETESKSQDPGSPNEWQ